MPLPEVVPPLPRKNLASKDLPQSAAMDWLRAGWSDFKDHNMAASVLYGFIMFAVSALIIIALFAIGADHILLPALSGFMVIGPAFAVGLYEKSRMIAAGEPVTFARMLAVRAESPGQIFFIGVLLCLLIIMWIRVAVLLYALFFGMHAFPGMDQILPVLFGTTSGLGLIIVGSIFGGLFAAFSFAISAFSIPMLLNERIDAFTAMGYSIVLVWHNLGVMLAWGAIVLALFVFSILTGLLGLIVAFPVLGHATWHAYKTVRPNPGEPLILPAIPSETHERAHG